MPNIDFFVIPLPKKIVNSDGSPPQPIGHVEDLKEQIRFAAHCQSCNFTLRETAEAIAEKFNCTKPHVSTIHGWLKEFRDAYELDCKELANEKRRQQGFIVDRLLKIWLPVALADNLPVTRYKTEDGKRVAYVDEEGFRERAQAAAIVIKLLERDARLWNLDRKDSERGDSVSVETINSYIVQQLEQVTPLEAQSKRERLELHAGEFDIDG